MYDVNGRWKWPQFANAKHDFKTCLTWPAWQDLDKGRLQEAATMIDSKPDTTISHHPVRVTRFKVGENKHALLLREMDGKQWGHMTLTSKEAAELIEELEDFFDFEESDDMSELHTDDNFMYENRLVGDEAEKTLADSIEEVYSMSLQDDFMDALDRELQKTEYFDSVWDAIEDGPMNTQVGGDHYRQGGIQPIEYIYANDLGFCEANAVKYLTRWKYKDGLKDLEKAKHYIELLIEMEFKNDD